MRADNFEIRLAYETSEDETPTHVLSVRIIADDSEESYTVGIDEHSERQIDHLVGRFRRLRDHIRGVKEIDETDLGDWDHDDLLMSMTVKGVDETGANIVVTTFPEAGNDHRTYEALIGRNDIEDFIAELEAGVQRDRRPVDVDFTFEAEEAPRQRPD